MHKQHRSVSRNMLFKIMSNLKKSGGSIGITQHTKDLTKLDTGFTTIIEDGRQNYRMQKCPTDSSAPAKVLSSCQTKKEKEKSLYKFSHHV